MTDDPFAPSAEPEPDNAPADAGALVLKRCRRLVEIRKERDAIDARDKVLIQEQKTVEAFLLDAFAQNPDLNNIRVAGRTVYLRRQLWAGAADKAAAHDALIAAGLAEYASKGFNTNSVSALFREWDRDGIEPPAELRGVITTGERFSIGVTK